MLAMVCSFHAKVAAARRSTDATRPHAHDSGDRA
jgi:hypothetical protein